MVVYKNVRCQWAHVHGRDCAYGEGIIGQGMHQINKCIKLMIKLNTGYGEHYGKMYLGYSSELCPPLEQL